MFTQDYYQIIAGCFPDLAIRRCQPIAEGWDSVAVAVNDDLIFRFPKRQDVEPQYETERRLLPALAGALPLPIPDVAFFWPGGASYHSIFIGHRRIAGAPLTSEDLTPAHSAGIAAQLGRFLSALHRFCADHAAQLGIPPANQASWCQRYRNQFAQIQADVLPQLDQPAQASIVRAWRAFLDDDTGFQVALVHHDLAGEHILYDSARSAISGIIDWGDAAIGDPAIDFAGLLGAYGEDFTEHVLAHYQGDLDASFRSRMRFYRDSAPLSTILFGLASGQDQFVQQGLKEIARKQ